MISLFKKPVLFFFIIFIILNSLSIFFYYSKQNSHVIKKSYSLDYELLNLVKEIDYIISVISNNPISSSKIVGMDEIEQLYFKMISTQSILNKDDKLIKLDFEVLDRSFKLKDYENRYISITYTSSSKEDLLAYIKNFDEKVLSIFRQNITKKLLGKQIILSINENFEDIKNIYNDEGYNKSYLFDSEKLNEKIDNIKLINSNTLSIEDPRGINNLIFYILFSSIISLFLSLILLAFNKKIEW